MSATLSRGAARFAARAFLVSSAAGGLTARVAAQGSNPLRKTDVVRLLASPVIGKSEIADLIRRNCLAFHPTERDWADLRSLGANAEILGSVGACTERSKSPELAPRAALVLAPLPERVVAPPDSDVLIRVRVKRGDLAQGGVALVLRGAATEPQAITDRAGWAQFHLRAGRAAGTYSLHVALKGEAASPDDPSVELVVRPAAPAMADILPSRLILDSADVGPVAVAVVVRDAFGNPVPGEPVDLRGVDEQMGLATDAIATDSVGRVTFVLQPRTIRRPGRVDVRVRGNRLAALDAAFADAVSGTESRFVTGAEQVGIARTQLNAPLVFQARSGAGKPLAGRMVSFAAQNAEVTPAQAVTDGAGQAQVQVTLGAKAGAALVVASIDSLQIEVKLDVQPAAATAVIIERNHVRVDGGRLVVPVESPFALSVSARDEYGNPVPVAGLARLLERMRGQFNSRSLLLKMESVQSDSWVTTVTFRGVGLGTTPLTIADATVTVQVVGPGAAR